MCEDKIKLVQLQLKESVKKRLDPMQKSVDGQKSYIKELTDVLKKSQKNAINRVVKRIEVLEKNAGVT